METAVAEFIQELGTIPDTNPVDMSKLDYLTEVHPYHNLTSAVEYFLERYPMLPVEAVQRYACSLYQLPFNSKTKRYLKRHEDEYLNDNQKRTNNIRERLLAKLKKRNDNKNNEKV